MKMSKEHFAMLKKEVDALLEKYPDTEVFYSQGLFPNADKVKNLQERFCFDVFHSTSQSLREQFYKVYDDSHIFTALKKCCPTITKRY